MNLMWSLELDLPLRRLAYLQYSGNALSDMLISTLAINTARVVALLSRLMASEKECSLPKDRSKSQN